MANWILRVCLLLSCLGCWWTRGQDVEEVNQVDGKKMNHTRPVNIFIINEKENRVANESILAALKSIREKGGNDLGKVWSVEITDSSFNESLSEVCNSWKAAVVEGGSPSENGTAEENWGPDFVLDTTRSGLAAKITNWFTATHRIPTLSAQFAEEDGLPYCNGEDEEKYLVQVRPPGDQLADSIRELIVELRYKNAGILFDHDFPMYRKYRTLLLNQPTRHLINRASQSVPKMMEQLVGMRNIGIVNYCIFGGQNTLNTALEAAQSLNFTGRRYGWFMFTLDEGFEVTLRDQDMSLLFIQAERTSLSPDLPKPPTSSGFYYDLTILGVQAIKSAIDNGTWPISSKHITCNANGSANGSQIDLLSILKESYKNIVPTYTTIDWGIKNGKHRVEFEMSISLVGMEEENTTRTRLGSWPASNLERLKEIIKSNEKNLTAIPFPAVDSYRIVTMIHPPFVMYDQKKKKWYGLCIDLMDEIGKKSPFEYEVHEAEDKEYGKMNEGGAWNGMIKELIEKKADIAIGTLWVTAERERVVDFTIPFHEVVGLSIIMPRKKKSTSPLMYATVFEKEVWCFILLSYIFTSSLVWIFDQWSPYSYQNNKKNYKEDDEKRVFNLRESFWFSLTSLTSQGGGQAPKNFSGKIIAVTWWFFGCVMIFTYAANLTAYLTILHIDPHPIKSLEDLTKQYKIEYAPVKNSAAHTYFKRMSKIESKMYDTWKKMILNDSLSEMERAKLTIGEYPMGQKYTRMYQAMLDAGLPSSTEDALKRLRRGNFAYIEDSSVVKYLVMTNCDLVQIGNDFSQKPFAVAIQKGSPLKDLFSEKILELMSERKLEELKKAWWAKNPNRKDCSAEIYGSDSLTDATVIVIVGACLIGIVCASITLALEYCYYRCKAIVTRIPKNSVNPMVRLAFETSTTDTLPRRKLKLRF